MKFEIKNRFTGSVQYSVELATEFAGKEYSLQLGAAVKSAVVAAANLSGAIGADYAIAQTRILPDGDLIGWKRCQYGVIVKLRIPEYAKRSHAFGRKCRAEFADVLEVIGADVGISSHDKKTEYRTGARIVPDSFDDNWQDECSNGVHFSSRGLRQRTTYEHQAVLNVQGGFAAG